MAFFVNNQVRIPAFFVKTQVGNICPYSYLFDK